MASGSINKLADLSTVESVEEYLNTSATDQQGIDFKFKNGDTFRIFVGKLDASNNYVQFRVNGVDKGYIKFTVSRNV